MVAQAPLLGQKGAYYHKWLAHRRLRPECFGGRIQIHLSGLKSYDISPAILHCDGIAEATNSNSRDCRAQVDQLEIKSNKP